MPVNDGMQQLILTCWNRRRAGLSFLQASILPELGGAHLIYDRERLSATGALMPTFNNPTADAAEAPDGVHGLTHAARVFEDPGDTYAVLDEFLAGELYLRQVIDQLATVHTANRMSAHDDAEDQTAGAAHALAASAELQQAAVLLDGVHDRVVAAMGASGRIAWYPAAAEPAPVSLWMSVVFLQGKDAAEVLTIIDREGIGAAIELLSGFDLGAETTQAALVNGYVYDTIPTGPLDRTITDGIYALTFNHDHGHVSLLRTHPESRETASELPQARTVPARPQTRRRSSVVDEDAWFAPSQSSSTTRERTL